MLDEFQIRMKIDNLKEELDRLNGLQERDEGSVRMAFVCVIRIEELVDILGRDNKHLLKGVYYKNA